MRKLFTLLTLALFLAPGLKAAGGPDAYGYTWTASTDVGGPTFSWRDISGYGTLVTGLGDDNSSPTLANIGFPFHYYWADYTQMRIGSNGWASFTSTVSNIASCFPTIPTVGGAGDNFLAALMGDLNFTGAGNPGQVFTYSNNVDTFIIMFKNVPFWTALAPGFTGSNNFEIILSGQDSSITYMYQTTGGFQNNAGCVDLSVGIENLTGNIGLSVWNDALPPGNYAIRFDYPATVLLSVQDLTPQWNMNNENRGTFMPAGNFFMKSNIKNVGNTNVVTSTNVTGHIRNLAFTSVANSSVSLASLAAGDDTTITFPTMANVATAGEYYFETTLTNAQDINGGNNINNTEIQVVNLCNTNLTLGYNSGNTSTGSINWNGGANDDGLGVHIVPPVYPVNITTMQVYVTSNSGLSLLAKIYADDGPGGAPGTLLYSGTHAAGNITVGSWSSHVLSTPVNITSGGFYVCFYQTGTTIFIGTENTGPISRQSYEILDNVFAEYRSNRTEDVMIRCVVNGHPTTAAPSFTYNINGTSVDFTNATVGGTYLWTFGDGATATTYNATHTYAPGIYNACLNVISGCDTTSMCDSIYICGSPGAAYSSGNLGNSWFFTDGTTNLPTSWTWDFGDGATSTQQNPVHNYASAGTYNVCLYVANACGNDTICTSINNCDTVTSAFSTSAVNEVVDFTDGSSGNLATWEWNFGDLTPVSNVQNPQHTYATCGDYFVCLTVTDSCGQTSTTCDSISVDFPPVASFTFNTSQMTTTFTDGSSGHGAFTYSWDFGDSSPLNTTQNPTHTYASNGTYTVCLTVTDTCGSDTVCSSVTINFTSIDDAFLGGVNVFPNPTAGEFVVSGNLATATEVGVTLSDLTGRVISAVAPAEMSGTIQLQMNLSSFPAGVYLVTVKAGEGFSTFRVVKD